MHRTTLKRQKTGLIGVDRTRSAGGYTLSASTAPAAPAATPCLPRKPPTARCF